MDTQRDFDAIVIGAGPGGLTAAAYLSMAGRRVAVVDARDEPGGHMSAFTHAGYEFDIGLHYTSEPAAQQVLWALGVDVEFRAFDPAGMFRMHGPDGFEFAVPRGVEQYRAQLHEAFPAERHITDAFLHTTQLLTDELAQLQNRPQLRELPRLPWEMRGLMRYGLATVGGYLDSLHASPQLRSVLGGWMNGSFAIPPSRLSLPAYAQVTRHYLDGMAYPQGGSRLITAGLADVIRRNHGELLLGVEASRILVNRGRVRGVRIRNASLDVAPEPEQDLLAPVVVSAVSVQQTYLRLLPPDVVAPRLLRRVRSYDMPLPLAGVYLVLNRDLAAEGYPNSNRTVSAEIDIETAYALAQAGEMPRAGFALVWVANLADPNNPRLCSPGQTNLQVMGVAPARHDWWGIAPGSGPTERYAARKRQVRDQLVALAERIIPDLSASIIHEETSTPITDERYTRSPGGVSYGPAFTPRQTFRRLGPTGAVSGLYLAGASVQPSHGLIGTLHGGAAAAAAITGIPTAELLTSGKQAPAEPAATH